MTNKEIKLNMIDALFDRGYPIKAINEQEYRTKCPYCGDSINEYYGHLYIHINPEDNLPMVWNCFKCGECGMVNQSFLTMMNIEDSDLKSSLMQLNKNSSNIKSTKFYEEEVIQIYDYEIPENINKKKLQYIENRLGISFTKDMIKESKIVFSLRDFLIHNKIHTLTLDEKSAYLLERDYVGFLSYGSSYILFRDITGKNKYAWIKYPITKSSSKSKCFYSMEASLDPFSTEPIDIILCEGVLDTLSSKYNLGNKNPNSLYIAVCGKRYDNIIGYLISLGLVGDNITITIYADNDKEFNQKSKNPTTIEYFRKVFYKYKYLFGKININYNILDKDIGVTKENISLRKYTL